MPTNANQLTDEHLDKIEGYMRAVAKGNKNPRGMPLHWLLRQWPEIDPADWERWSRLGATLGDAHRVDQLGDALHRLSIEPEVGARYMVLARLWRSLELGSVGHYMGHVEDLAGLDLGVTDDEGAMHALDPRVRIKALQLVLNRLEPGRWSNSGKAPDAEEVAEPAPASARVRAIPRDRIENLTDDERREIEDMLEAEAAADQARKEREARIKQILERRE